MKFGKAIPCNIRIEATANMGFDVHVGCFHGSFSDKAILLDALADYLNDPKGVEEQYNKAFDPEGGITLNLKGNVAPLGTISPGTPLNVT